MLFTGHGCDVGDEFGEGFCSFGGLLLWMGNERGSERNKLLVGCVLGILVRPYSPMVLFYTLPNKHLHAAKTESVCLARSFSSGFQQKCILLRLKLIPVFLILKPRRNKKRSLR